MAFKNNEPKEDIRQFPYAYSTPELKEITGDYGDRFNRWKINSESKDEMRFWEFLGAVKRRTESYHHLKMISILPLYNEVKKQSQAFWEVERRREYAKTKELEAMGEIAEAREILEEKYTLENPVEEEFADENNFTPLEADE